MERTDASPRDMCAAPSPLRAADRDQCREWSGPRSGEARADARSQIHRCGIRRPDTDQLDPIDHQRVDVAIACRRSVTRDPKLRGECSSVPCQPEQQRCWS